MYADQPDCVELVETLSEKFKSLYEAEVCLLSPFSAMLCTIRYIHYLVAS